MPIPREHEIREYAKAQGLVDANGRYLRSRAYLAAQLQTEREQQQMAEEVADLEGPENPYTTAEVLAQFKIELDEHGLSMGYAQVILGAVAGALVEREGLKLERNPQNG